VFNGRVGKVKAEEKVKFWKLGLGGIIINIILFKILPQEK
jgi:hypothetical protein